MTNTPPQIEEIKDLPEVVSLLPLRNSVLFPGSIIPIDVGRPKSVKLIEEAIASERPVIGIVTQKQARTEEPGAEDLHQVGCAVRILKVIKLARDNYSVILQGVMRIKIDAISTDDPFLQARVSELPEVQPSALEAEALVANIKETAQEADLAGPRAPARGRGAARQRQRARPGRRPGRVQPRHRAGREARGARGLRRGRRGCARS